jgi:predicted GNAT family N-acyltransferase
MTSPVVGCQSDLFDIRRYEGCSHVAMEGIRRLRQLVWATVHEAGYSLDDEFDERAIHWTVYSDEKLIAAARLTVHTDLKDVPERRLFQQLSEQPIAAPIGCLSRLVVHPSMRGRGLAAKLDKVRVEAAISAKCQTMIINWTPMSGESRRKQILAMGFASPDGNTPHPDEGFGVSFIFYMPLDSQCSSPAKSESLV